MSYSPNLFGSQAAMEAWEKITDIIGYSGDDDFQKGDRPYINLISKSLLGQSKIRRKLIAKVSESERTYAPGILIIGYLMMSKGLPLASDLRQEMRRALITESFKIDQLKGFDKKQRKRQLNHINNLLDEYDNKPTRVLLYGNKKNKERNKKRDARKRDAKKKRIVMRRQMTKDDIRSFSYTYLLMRLFNSASKTNTLFRIYAPNINTSQLVKYMYDEGFCDSRGRPNQQFRNHIYTLLADKGKI